MSWHRWCAPRNWPMSTHDWFRLAAAMCLTFLTAIATYLAGDRVKD
jgi:hypothetical protein